MIVGRQEGREEEEEQGSPSLSFFFVFFFDADHFKVWASQVALLVKIPTANAGDRSGFDPWVGKIPWRAAWKPSPVFLPGESHGQRSRAGYIGSQRVAHDGRDLEHTCILKSLLLLFYVL